MNVAMETKTGSIVRKSWALPLHTVKLYTIVKVRITWVQKIKSFFSSMWNKLATVWRQKENGDAIK